MKRLTVEDVTSFVQQVKVLGEKWRSSNDVVGPWYRGQSNSEWSLVPKFYRTCDRSRGTEDEIREEFTQR